MAADAGPPSANGAALIRTQLAGHHAIAGWSRASSLESTFSYPIVHVDDSRAETARLEEFEILS